jgi:threonine dehydrogenase-like Zn-dependent dehydrogenase
MRALVLTDWWRLEVREVETPQPGPDDVVIDVVATGICGSDVHGYTGENGRRRIGQVMGHETVGRVREVGSAVHEREGLSIGAAVTVNPVIACGRCEQCVLGNQAACPRKSVVGVDPDIVSAFADLLVVPAANVVPLSEAMPIELGALVEPLSVGYHALRRGNCSPSDSVLIIGGGPIGQACVLAAQRIGARLIMASEPDANRRSLLSELGVSSVNPSERGQFPARVIEGLGGEPSLVVDAVGSAQSLEAALSVAKQGARIVLVGMAAPQFDLAAYAISVSERTLIGSFCYTAEEFVSTAEWLRHESEKVGPLIDSRVRPEMADGSFQKLARGEGNANKVLIMFQ